MLMEGVRCVCESLKSIRISILGSGFNEICKLIDQRSTVIMNMHDVNTITSWVAHFSLHGLLLLPELLLNMHKIQC